MKLIKSLTTTKLYSMKSILDHSFRTVRMSVSAAKANREMVHWIDTEIKMRQDGRSVPPQEEKVLTGKLA